MTIWLNGELVENGSVAASSAGVTVGWGVFTTVAVRDGVPHFARRHIERLRRDAVAANIEMATSMDESIAGMEELIGRNMVRDGLLRLTLTRRSEGRWNEAEGADLSIQALSLSFSPSAAPIRVQLSPYRTESNRPLVGVKTTSYLTYLWAWREAKAGGFDEAILRESLDSLSEAARSNIFWVKNGELFTPGLETGCLRGLGRELVLEWAKANAKVVHQGHYSVFEALDATETFLVSAAAGPRLISSWHDENGAPLRKWSGAPDLERKLQNWWRQTGAD